MRKQARDLLDDSRLYSICLSKYHNIGFVEIRLGAWCKHTR